VAEQAFAAVFHGCDLLLRGIKVLSPGANCAMQSACQLRVGRPRPQRPAGARWRDEEFLFAID